MKHYLVTIATGEYEDKTDYHIFTTPNKEKAEEWKNKFNRIKETAKEWVGNYNVRDRNVLPFMYWERLYYNPKASVTEVEFRE